MRRWPGRSLNYEIFKFLCLPHLLENTLEDSPDCSPGPQPHVPRLFRASSKVSQAEERGLEDPAGLTINNGLQNGLYTHPCQAGRTSHRRPPPLTPDYPYPLMGVSILRGSRASTQAYLHTDAQHILVDLEEPRSLRPSIGWPASGAMHHPAYQLRRIPLPRRWMTRSGQDSSPIHSGLLLCLVGKTTLARRGGP